MLNINNFEFSFKQVANADFALLLSIKPYNTYENGVRTAKHGGFAYEVVLPNNGYEKIIIRVPDEQTPAVPIDTIDDKNLPKIKPVNFTGKFYQNRNGEYAFSAKASGMEVTK